MVSGGNWHLLADILTRTQQASQNQLEQPITHIRLTARFITYRYVQCIIKTPSNSSTKARNKHCSRVSKRIWRGRLSSVHHASLTSVPTCLMTIIQFCHDVASSSPRACSVATVVTERELHSRRRVDEQHNDVADEADDSEASPSSWRWPDW